MRIVIDCFKQVKGAGKSIGIYNVAHSMIQNLILERSRTENEQIRNAEIVVLGNQHNACDFQMDGVKFVEIQKFDPLNKIHCVLWELFEVSRVCKKLKADRVLFPRGFCALTHPVKDIVMIHDLIPFYYDEHFPGVFGKLENAYIMNRLKASAKTADRVLTISEASKRDILKYCGVLEDKITVVHNACNAISFDEEKLPQEKPYICAVTSGLPHKNARGILESYKKYCEVASDPIDLVVIGIADTSACELPDVVKEKITCHKFIKSNQDMYRIINNSTVFLFLSLVEGFGLPPIEAMQLRVPVICSNVSSLPEVVGDAAVLVDPMCPEAVAEKLDSLIRDGQQQVELTEKGVQNVKRFSWETRAKLYWEELLR